MWFFSEASLTGRLVPILANVWRILCKRCAGVVGFSGRLIDPEQAVDAKTRPPILLIHGDEDPVVPFDSMGIAGEALQNAGFTVYGHVMKGTGHGISPDGLSVALAFLKERFSARS